MITSQTHQYVQTLRLYLVDMCRLSQRCVDYAIKAFQLRRPEMYVSARDNPNEVETLHHDAMELARDLLRMELSCESDLRFVVASMRICHALYRLSKSARQIVENGARLIHADAQLNCGELSKMGDLASRILRLSIDALLEEELELAVSALRIDEIDRLFPMAFYAWYTGSDLPIGPKTSFALSIMQGLMQIARQAHEIADAVVFWLSDTADVSCPRQSSVRGVERLTTPLEHFPF